MLNRYRICHIFLRLKYHLKIWSLQTNSCLLNNFKELAVMCQVLSMWSQYLRTLQHLMDYWPHYVSIVQRVILFRIFARFLCKDSSTTVTAKIISFIFVAMCYCKFLVHFNTANRVNRHYFELLRISIYIYRCSVLFIIF